MYVTVYSKTVKRRATKRVETVACAYRTKSLTDMHARIHEQHPDAQTWEDPKQVYTQLMTGLPLVKPVVVGGILLRCETVQRGREARS